MDDHPSPQTHPPSVRGLWRLLVLDRDPQDPKWLLATVTLESDVLPARLDALGQPADWPEVTTWLSIQGDGGHPYFVTVHAALVWAVNGGRQ